MSLSLFLVIAIGFAPFYGGEGSPCHHSRSKSALSPHPVVIVLSFDGLRHDFTLFPFIAPNIDKIRNSGTYAPRLDVQFPSVTFANHQSIATGLNPSSHGVVHNTVYDPVLDKVLRGGNPELWNYQKDVVPLWVSNEWAGDGRYSGVTGWPGSQFGYGPNQSHPTHFLLYKEPNAVKETVDTIVSWITNDTHPANLVFAYFDEPDITAHEFGPNSNQTKTAIQKIDDLVGYLVKKLKRAGVYNKVNFILLSDHGFASFTQRNIIDITNLTDASRYDIYGASPLLFINPHEGEFDNVFNELRSASLTSNFNVIRSDWPNPFWDSQNLNPRVLPIALLANEGFAFQDTYRSYVNYYEKVENATAQLDRKYGMHGYDNRLKNMGATFIAHGPAFRNDGFEVPKFKNVDVYPLVCDLISISCPPSNGTIAHTRGLLRG